MDVTPAIMARAETLDEMYWEQYIHEVKPDDQQYLPFVRWLCFKLGELEKK